MQFHAKLDTPCNTPLGTAWGPHVLVAKGDDISDEMLTCLYVKGWKEVFRSRHVLWPSPKQLHPEEPFAALDFVKRLSTTRLQLKIDNYRPLSTFASAETVHVRSVSSRCKTRTKKVPADVFPAFEDSIREPCTK